MDKTRTRLQYSTCRLGRCAIHLNTNLKGELPHEYEPVKRSGKRLFKYGGTMNRRPQGGNVVDTFEK